MATIPKNKNVEDSKDSLNEVLLNYYTSDSPNRLREALGFKQEELNLLYNDGYKKFQSGQYRDALAFFVVLHQLEPDTFRYTFAIAATYHYLKDYANAVTYYLEALKIDPSHAMPLYHLFDCLNKLGKPDKAKFVLTKAIQVAGEQPKYKYIKERAKLELAQLT